MTQQTYRRVARDAHGLSYLWVVTRDAEGYQVCRWRLNAADVLVVEAWDQMMSRRRSNGLPELPAPDSLSQREPEKLNVADIESARSFLVGEDESALAWHAQEFFHHIDPTRHENSAGISRMA